MKKVLLVNAIGSVFGNTDESPSVALMALSAALKAAGYETGLVFSNWSEAELAAHLQDTVAVGFSVLTGNGITQALSMAGRIKAIRQDMPIIWGGHHPTLKAEQTLKHPLVDFIVRGEGEITLVELLRALEAGANNDTFAGIAGLSFKQGCESCHNPNRQASDINAIPLPDLSLYEKTFRSSREIPYISSRGCPFDCRFCCNAAFNRQHGLRFRQSSISRVLDDLESISRQYDPKMIFMWDDLFLATPSRVASFVEGYRRKNFQFGWQAFGRCDIFSRLSESTVRDLQSVNLKRVFFGVESGSPDILERIRKRQKVDDVLAAAKKLQSFEIGADFTFMNGFPGETRQDVRANLRLRQDLKRILPECSIRFFVYTPLPGTEMLEDCEHLGYHPPETLEEWATYEYHAFDSPWLDRGHRRFIQNIAYATLLDSLDTAGWKWSFRHVSTRVAQQMSRLRLKHGMLSCAPELWALWKLHERGLRATPGLD